MTLKWVEQVNKWYEWNQQTSKKQVIWVEPANKREYISNGISELLLVSCADINPLFSLYISEARFFSVQLS